MKLMKLGLLACLGFKILFFYSTEVETGSGECGLSGPLSENGLSFVVVVTPASVGVLADPESDT